MWRVTVLWVVALVSVLILLGVFSSLSAQAGERWEGTYACIGKDLDGAAYAVELVLAKQGNTLYSYVQSTHNGRVAIGVAFAEEQTLVVGFATAQGFGVALYHREGRALKGRWTAYGAPHMTTETCTPTGSLVA